MKIIRKDENTFDFYLQKQSFKNINFDNKNTLENYFQDFFLKLKQNYKFDVCGFYAIDIYIDNTYGVVISMLKEDVDYYDYFNSNIDMQISKPKKTKFLYKVDDLFFIDKKILNKLEIYDYMGDYYLKSNNISNKEIIKLIEFSEIIYDETEKIIKFGNLIKLEV